MAKNVDRINGAGGKDTGPKQGPVVGAFHDLTSKKGRTARPASRGAIIHKVVADGPKASGAEKAVKPVEAQRRGFRYVPRDKASLHQVEAEKESGPTYADHTMAAIHETMTDLASLGLASKEMIRDLETSCLTKAPAITAQYVRALRKREQVSQVVLARYLGVSVNTVSQWERGERRAAGAAAKLLQLIDKHGLAYIR